MLLILACMLAAPPDAPAAARAVRTVTGDQAATGALLEAEYELVKATLARAGALESAGAEAAKALGDECKGVLAGAPEEPVLEEEDPRTAQPKLSGRAQGERARSQLEKQTIETEIGETLNGAADRVLRGPYDAFIAKASPLVWSDPTVTSLVRQKATQLREELIGSPVAVCAEMRAWAASGFHVLPLGSRLLKEAREARDRQAVDGNLEKLLRPYEDHTSRVILKRIKTLTGDLRETLRNLESSLNTEYHLDLALGEKAFPLTRRRHVPVIAKGRTHAGTTFVIRPGAHERPEDSCKYEVQVEVDQPEGSNLSSINDSGLCLGKLSHPNPSSSCSRSVETIQFATPPDVSRALIRLSNGKTVTTAIVHIPAKYGGPAGVFINAFATHNSYPVVAQELSRDGQVLRTINLKRDRCTQEAGEEPGPEPVNLTTVTSPSGEPLPIEATLHRFHGQTELLLFPAAGIRGSEGGDEPGKPRQFQWDLSTECAPHPYSLLDGILTQPGASVLARTPTGLTPLTKVGLAASTHAPGPLFYGIYTTTPTEIVVERADGTVLYTESLTVKATEETEFCEGYAEP